MVIKVIIMIIVMTIVIMIRIVITMMMMVLTIIMTRKPSKARICQGVTHNALKMSLYVSWL